MSLAILTRHWRAVALGVLVAALSLQTWRIDRFQRSLKAADAAAIQARAAATAAEDAVRARDAAMRASADNEKRDAEEMASITKGTCRAAFDAGYAARRCALGEPGGVRDLKTLWRDGAFPGAGGVSGQPDG